MYVFDKDIHLAGATVQEQKNVSKKKITNFDLSMYVFDICELMTKRSHYPLGQDESTIHE